MRKSAKHGLDGLEFEIILHGIDSDKVLPEQPIINQLGMEYGHVKARDGKAKVDLCLPKFARSDNVKPYSISDLITLEIIRNDYEGALSAQLGNISDSRLTGIECNITIQILSGCRQTHVLDLLNRSHYDTTNLLFESASPKCKYLKEKETLSIPRRNYYWIKCYNKTKEQRDKGNLNVEDGLLRIEIKMIGQTIKKLFGDDSTIRDVLCAKNLIKVMDEYSRIFNDEIVEAHIKPCLTGITNILLESLTQTDSPVETIARHRDLIVDIEVLRRALKRWYRLRGKNDISRQEIHSLKKKYDLPQNVIATIKEFRKSCG